MKNSLIRKDYSPVIPDGNRNDTLKIAIQKSGRLYDDSVKLLKDCGIDLKNGVNKLKAECDNFPMEIYFLRDDDIPQYVEDAVADVGIVGENVFYEKEKKAVIVEQLGFGKCRLSVAVGRAEISTCLTGCPSSYIVKNVSCSIQMVRS